MAPRPGREGEQRKGGRLYLSPPESRSYLRCVIKKVARSISLPGAETPKALQRGASPSAPETDGRSARRACCVPLSPACLGARARFLLQASPPFVHTQRQRATPPPASGSLDQRARLPRKTYPQLQPDPEPSSFPPTKTNLRFSEGGAGHGGTRRQEAAMADWGRGECKKRRRRRRGKSEWLPRLSFSSLP